MEIMISRNSTIRTIMFMLVVMAVLGGGYFAWQSGLLNSLFAQTQNGSAAPADEPAIQSLTALYAPSGERAEWEGQVCAGMTAQGCQLFRTLFANPIWNSALQGKTSSVTFIEIAETLSDGSQVWETSVTTGEVSLPVYVHVTQNETSRWLLNRVLFAQEAAQYENQK